MIYLAITHEKRHPVESHICAKLMQRAFHQFCATVDYKAGDCSEMIKSLKTIQVIANAGHLLAFSAVWDATKFNKWVHWLNYCFKKKHGKTGTKDVAVTMYKESRGCRYITERDLLMVRNSKESLLDSTEGRLNSACPSSEKVYWKVLKQLPLGLMQH